MREFAAGVKTPAGIGLFARSSFGLRGGVRHRIIRASPKTGFNSS
jgi:hypothetical protein